MSISIKLDFYGKNISSDLYYKPFTVVNDGSSIVNKLETALSDDVRVIIYIRHMFIVQATGEKGWGKH
jgi:hypothetical protein